MKKPTLFHGIAVFLAFIWLTETARSDDTVIKLKKDFIEKHKNRVTIDTNLTIDKVGKVHKAADDGDVHMSGRAPEVGLAMVAEIKNAKSEVDAVINARQVAKDQTPVKVSGAWRFWCEHTSNHPHIQGKALSPFPDSNPSHVFEIHPVTKFNGTSLLRSVRAINGYKYKEASRAFLQYENTSCRLKEDGDSVLIRTRQAGFNHVEFIIQSVDDEVGGMKVEDGRFMFASVHDLDGELLVRKVRTAFIKDTDAEKQARTLKKGQRLRVVGIPRISLTLISWRIEHAHKPEWKDFDVLQWHLPYEMIIIAVTGEEDGDDDE